MEFKKSLSEWKEIVEIVSAFSNTKGGTIVVGIGDDGKIHGVTIGKSTIEDLTNKILINTEPKIYPEITTRTRRKKSYPDKRREVPI
ncbi:MAG: AlbA family DNA-binding domain-containing protein [Methanoculleaceae archaeon]